MPVAAVLDPHRLCAAGVGTAQGVTVCPQCPLCVPTVPSHPGPDPWWPWSDDRDGSCPGTTLAPLTPQGLPRFHPEGAMTRMDPTLGPPRPQPHSHPRSSPVLNPARSDSRDRSCPSHTRDQPHFIPAESNVRGRSCPGTPHPCQQPLLGFARRDRTQPRDPPPGPQPHSRDAAPAFLADVQLLHPGHGLAGPGREPAGERGCGTSCGDTRPSGSRHPRARPSHLPPCPPDLLPHPPEPPGAGGRCWIAAGPPAAPGAPAASCRPPSPPPSASWPAPSPGCGAQPPGEVLGGFPAPRFQDPPGCAPTARPPPAPSSPGAAPACPALPRPHLPAGELTLSTGSRSAHG